MPDTPLLLAAIKYRARLDAQSAEDLQRLIDAYGLMARRLKDKVDLLVLEIASSGIENITTGQISRMARYKDLLEALQRELAQYDSYLAVELDRIANAALAQANLDVQQLIRMSGGITGSLNKLPASSIKTLLGFLDPDSPLFKRLSELAPLTADEIGKRILEAVGLGYNPAKTADLISDILGQGLTDALRWARTTQMWTYREASRATMAANGDVLDGWVWFAILDDSVPPCESCLANHGQLFPLDEPLDDHYNGRCVAIPHVKGEDNPLGSGEEWFRSLPEDKQAEILGQGKLAALNEGKFTFDQLTQRVDDDVFGSMRVGVPLKDLVKESE